MQVQTRQTDKQKIQQTFADYSNKTTHTQTCKQNKLTHTCTRIKLTKTKQKTGFFMQKRKNERTTA